MTEEERQRRGGTGRAYLVPIGDIYPDEQYIIIRGRNGLGVASFEQHYEYLNSEQEQVKISVQESRNAPIFKIGPIRND